MKNRESEGPKKKKKKKKGGSGGGLDVREKRKIYLSIN
jgi:hypothetical protein